MNDLDDKIKAVLESELGDRALGLGNEPGMFEQIMELTRGKRGVYNVATWIVSVVFLGVFVFATVRFFDAETTHEMIGYAVVGGYSAAIMCMLKLWSWMQMNLNLALREIKRLELMVAMLASKRRGE